MKENTLILLITKYVTNVEHENEMIEYNVKTLRISKSNIIITKCQKSIYKILNTYFFIVALQVHLRKVRTHPRQ